MLPTESQASTAEELCHATVPSIDRRVRASRPGKHKAMHIIGLILLGLVVGALGRLFHKGRDPMGLVMTIAIGVASVLIAGLLIHGFLGFIVAVVVGVLLVALWSRFAAARRSPGSSQTPHV
jgi:uncharacterized membrane protein YeaQ/YmgE (transglycosylase-associated protein family)